MKRLLPLLLLVAFASCNKNRVKLVATNAKDEVPSLGNLVFTFDKNLVGDTLLNLWDSTAYISFDPPIEGRFQWTSAYELTFSPVHDLQPSTDYKAVLTDKLVSHCQYKLGFPDDLHFHTPYQKLETANAMWTVRSESSNTPVIQLDLLFTYKTKAEQLEPKLHVEADGKKCAYQFLTHDDGTNFSLLLTDIKVEDAEKKIRVTVDAGLMPMNGKCGSKEASVIPLTLPSPFLLNINNAEANHDGTEGVIRIYTSQQPIAQNLNEFVTVDPPVAFKTQVTEDGFLISSEKFLADASYSITIKQGLKGRIGGTLKENYSNQFTFGELEPTIKFTNSKGVYLTPAGSKNIEVQIVNVPKISIAVYKVYENNLLASQNYGDNDYSYESDSYGEEDEASVGYGFTFGDKIYETTVETRTLPKRGSSRLLKFDFVDKLKDLKGIYRLSIRSESQYYLRESRFISLSDIGLIARNNGDQVWVFANSIKTAEKLSNVQLSIIGTNNQVVGTGTTDKDGFALLTISKRDFSGFRPRMIIARTANDFNFMPFNSTQVESSRFDVGGKNSNSTNLDAFIYSERDMYRPGEKMNISCIVRNNSWHSPGEIPVKLKILLPNGQELKTVRKTLNDEGSMETAVELSPAAVTGSYSVELYSSNDVLLNSSNILVEEFMPDRIKVTTSLDKPFLRPGDGTTLSVLAENYFGPPAANRNYEVEIQTNQQYFSPKKFSSYTFSLNNSFDFNSIEREGKTDEKGMAKESWTVPETYKNNGLLQANWYTTVFDESGRPVNRKSHVSIYTQDVFFGIGNMDYYCALNKPMSIPLIAVNKDEQSVSATAHVLIIKHEYKTVLSKAGSYYRYESQQVDHTVMDEEIRLEASGRILNYVPKTPGDYEIRIAAPGVNNYVNRTFFSYGWAMDGSSFEVNNEGNVDIELDKSQYEVGESAKVLFKAPFNGKLLVTVETNKVLEHFYLQTDKRTASANISLKADYLPNAYITATLIKPHDETDLPLTVAHGFKSIAVQEKKRKMEVKIIAAKSVRSHTHQKVKVLAASNSKVTLAAVDEGILAMTGFKTPNPYDFFYQKRALEVMAFDLYPLLFPEVNSVYRKTGGDGFDLSKRVNPVQNKRVKLLTYWSGITETNGSGEANFEFDLPQFSGEVRLMAVAYKDVAFGNAEEHMTVADPIVISTGLPRFVAPRDTIDVPVTITNTTNSGTNAGVNVKTEGPLAIIGSSVQSVSISGKKENRVVFRVTPTGMMDAAKVIVEVNGGGEKYRDETEITIRPSASLQKGYGSGNIPANSVTNVNCGNANFIPSTQNIKLTVSRSPMMEYAKDLRYLIQYPYGCTEQTVSAAFPQLYFEDLAAGLNPAMSKTANYNVNEAIRKIKMRQLYNGGLTLWDGGGEEHWWASVYAAHFLVEARKAGFDIDDSLLQKLLEFLEAKLRDRNLITWYYNRGNNKKIAPHEVAYSLYVLALAGKQQPSTMNYYKSNPQLLTLDAKYLLAAAYALAGDKAHFNEMLPPAFAGEISDKETGGAFASPVRDEALSLSVLADVDPQNPQLPVMARHVSEALKSEGYLSTQERVFSFIGLGKTMRQYANSNATAEIVVNGKIVGEMKGAPITLTSKQLGGSKVEIRTHGNQKVFYSYENEGLTADGSFKQEDNYLKVRKRFYDRHGHELNNLNFRQNDLVVIGISVETSYSRGIENVVLTDMLPAGFEIENPRIKELPGMDWIKDAWIPNASDYRDDRVNLFVDVNSGRVQHYYYVVRAVSLGSFRMGPVSADAMYAGEYHSYNGGGVITIKP
ncbi:MAG: MG2 domain-containing protein [Chitinophagales bacterium]